MRALGDITEPLLDLALSRDAQGCPLHKIIPFPSLLKKANREFSVVLQKVLMDIQRIEKWPFSLIFFKCGDPYQGLLVQQPPSITKDTAKNI